MLFHTASNGYEIELSVPSLHTFSFTGQTMLKIYGSKSNLSSIKHVNIHLRHVRDSAETSLVLLSWLVEFASIESLTVSLDALQVLYRHVWFWQENFHFIFHFKLQQYCLNMPAFYVVFINFINTTCIKLILILPDGLGSFLSS
jgi:hypothetical protein